MNQTIPISRPYDAVETILCFSHLRWKFVYQRPQHLMSRIAHNADVFYFEEPIFEDLQFPILRHEAVAPGITVLVPVLPHATPSAMAVSMQRKLVDELLEANDITPSLIWYYNPLALEFSDHLSANLRVYDNMDELSAFQGASPDLLQKEHELFGCADLVFTGGNSLYESKRHRHSDIHPFPSSIDVHHFAKARMPGSDRLSRENAVVGFFGVIDERMDIELLAILADLRPDWAFEIVGPVVKIDPDSLPRRSNIQWLGSKSYDELPSHLRDWDVGIMPFAINEATRFISPTKTPEFLAAGVPVISTPIADVIRPYGELGLVEIAATAAQIAAKAEMLLTRPREPWLSAVDRHLSKMSWDITWASMKGLLEKAGKRTDQLEREKDVSYV